MNGFSSYRWKKLDYGSNSDRPCHLCRATIVKRTPGTWKREGTGGVKEFACPGCIKIKEAKCQ